MQSPELYREVWESDTVLCILGDSPRLLRQPDSWLARLVIKRLTLPKRINILQDKNIKQLLKLPPGSKQLHKYHHLLLERWQVQDSFISNVETTQVSAVVSHSSFFSSDNCRPMTEQSIAKNSPANTSHNSQVWTATSSTNGIIIFQL